MHALLESCLNRGRTVLLVLALVLITGSISYLTIPKEASPDITVPFVYVNLHYEGISPEDAERLLVRPMEQKLRGLEGLKEMTATAFEGGANIILEFEAGLDIDPILIDVREKVDRAKADLPDGTDEPTVSEINLALMPVIVISLSGDIPERQLLRLARDLRDELEGISEVLEVEIGGDREEVVEVVVEPALLESYGLSLAEVAAAARRNNVLIAAGNLDSGAGRIPVKVPGLFQTPQDILELPIRAVDDTVIRTQDIATVLPTFKDPAGFSRVNGSPALTLYVKKRVGENVIATVDKVRALVAAKQKSWPPGVEVSFSQDQSNDIKTMLRDLQNNVLSAIILVMVVCVAALGLRGGLLVGLAIPGSFLAGILALHAMGLTVNIVVLFSLILAVGMLVDGAIVVVELADRKMNEGLPRSRAYLIASQRMAAPIISSTATTLAAFLPLLFWPGVVGEFMKFLPITLIATLSASLLMALIFVPTVGTLIGKPGPASHETMRSLAAAEGGDLTQLRGFTGWYVRMLRHFLRHPAKILLVVVLAFIAVQLLYSRFGKGVEFFPDVDLDFASILVRMRGNLSIHEMDAVVREVEERILQVEGIKTITARSSVSFMGDDITEDTHGLIQIEFLPWQERRPAKAILKEIALRTEGLNGIGLELVEEQAGRFRVAVHAAHPLNGARLRETLNGLQDRLRLIRDWRHLELRDTVASVAEPPQRIATLELALAAPEPWAAVFADLQPLLRGVPGVIIEQRRMDAGPPTGKDVQIELSSHQPHLLEQAVQRVREHMETVEGLRDIDDSRPAPGVEWQVRVDRAQASRFGADISLVGSYVQFVTNGLLLGTYRPDGSDDEVDIRARFPGGMRDLKRLRELRVATPAGNVPVTNFIEWAPAPQVGRIHRVDGRRYYTVTANVDAAFLTDTKVRELQEWQSTLEIPEGLNVRFRGEDEEQRKSAAFLSKAFFVAVFIMAIILVTQFNSFFHALLVLTAVVFSTIGVFLGLLLTGQPFGVVMNGIGVIALAGIVVNNNIVLIDTFNYHRNSGAAVTEAILRTGAQRLRPVLLTTITTAFGLLPMVLRLNIDLIGREITYNAPSTQWWVQLSTSVAFGLLFATFLTLILTPALLMLGDNIGGWLRRRRPPAPVLRASPAAPARVEAIIFYRSPLPDPLIASANTRLHLKKRADEEPGWVYATGPDGKEGWVPRSWLRIEGDAGVLKQDYNATELDLEVGDELLVTRVVDGWYWARNAAGREGWIPARAVRILRQGD